MKNIFLLHTGGTIGMAWENGRYVPRSGHLQQVMARNSAFAHPDLPAFELYETDPLLDSSAMTPARWNDIAQVVRRAHDSENIAGIVVLHGTDTMAYTASALAFMLENLAKPVILTGSQIPLMELRNDAQDNLVTSMLIAAHANAFREVCLYFNHKLMRGCRTTKVNADGFDAFDSPNYPPLAEIGIDMGLDESLPPQPAALAKGDLEVTEIQDPTVAVLRLFPGISSRIVGNLLQDPLKGLVLEAYGAGNGPSDPSFLDLLRREIAGGKVVVGVTQCLRGTVNLDLYGTGLGPVGVTSGRDLTTEAAVTKLFYLLSRRPPLTPERIRQEMQRDLRGELTEPTPE